MTAKRKIIAVVVMALYVLAVIPLGFVIHGNGELRTKQNACFAFVIVNFLASFAFAEKSADFVFGSMALFFTVIADRIITYNVMELIPLGITLFTFTQTSYFFKNFCREESNAKKIVFGSALPVFIVTGLILVKIFIGSLQYLFVIALTYFGFLVISCVFAFTRFPQDPLFALGLLLFICCDVVLGLQVIGVSGEVANIIYSLDCWWFYYPSQILIVFGMAYTALFKRAERKYEK